MRRVCGIIRKTNLRKDIEMRKTTEIKIYSPETIKKIVENSLVLDWGFENTFSNSNLIVETREPKKLIRELEFLGYEIY